MFNRFKLKMFAILVLIVVTSCAIGMNAEKERKPNIVFIFIDDMGYADPSCFGNDKVSTPNMDRLAEEGVRLTNFYVNSPICSPSRVAVTTGTYPGRWGVHAHFAGRQENQRRAMVDFLNPNAPTLARTLQQAGYATGHFGKWHMGGGRDVDDAPLPKAYGYDESLVAFEGLGDRQLIEDHGLSKASAKLKQGNIQWVKKYQMTENYVDRAIAFIKQNQDKPFYVDLWPNDVHDPHLPSPKMKPKYKDIAANEAEQEFFAVLDEMDRQIGRFLDALKEMGLEEETIVLLTSDNGPTDWPRYYEAGITPPGSTGPFFGRKWSLYEGGIREPFMIRWPGHIPAGKTNDQSVACGIDIFPSLCAMADVQVPANANLDGVDMSQAFKGKPVDRPKPVFWEYPRKSAIMPGNPKYVSPNLAVRDGDWKLLINADGSNVQLYNLKNDIGETENVAEKYPEVTKRLSRMVLDWRPSVLELRTK